MKKLTAFALLLLILAALLPGSAQATPQRSSAGTKGRITIGLRTSGAAAADNRGRYEYEIAPRGVKEDFIALYNYADTAATVRLLPLDAGNTTNGDFTVEPSANKPVDAGSWIVAARTEIHLKARSMTIVPFQISVPYDATPGDHVGALIVSLLARQPSKRSGNVVVEHRVGLRVYLRVPGALTPRLRIEHLTSSFAGSWTSLGFGHTDVSYSVRNTGNVRLSGTQVVRLARAFGLSAATARPAALGELLPGSLVEVHQSFPTRWAIAHLTTTVSLSPRGVDKSFGALPLVTATTARFVLPWLLILILLVLIVLGTGYGTWRARRRKARGAAPEALRTPGREPALVGSASGGKHAGAPTEKRSRGGRRRAVLGIHVLAVIALGGLVGLGGTADRADAHSLPKPWQATVVPTHGADDEPFSIRTSGACPAPARSIIGRVYGAGFPAAGVNVIGNTSAGVSQAGGFQMPIFETLRDTMVAQKRYVPLRGTYHIVVRCIIPAFIDRSYGDYAVDIKFLNPNHWVASPPVSRVIGPHTNPDGSVVGPHLPNKAGKVTPSKLPTAASAAPGASATPPSAAGSLQQPVASKSSSGGPSGPAIALIVGGVLILGTTLRLYSKGRS